jgi:predicted metal-dependent HD superfamily phosphohydrolase
MKWLVLVTTHKGSPQTELEDIICDLDLREFVNDRQPLNAVEVRKEYSFLSDEEWNEGRTAFVKSMLDKEYIYHTDEYRGALEDTARINLQKELDTIT